MNIKSLTLKNKLVDENTGKEYYDLSAPSFKYNSDLGIKGIHYVLQDQAGRMDKISEIYFGSTEFVDALCIVNNIFNPFSVNEGDVLVIPNLSREDLVYKKPQLVKRLSNSQEDYINTGQASEQDKERIKRLTSKAKEKKSGVKIPMPPNMLQPGSQAKQFDKGGINLGTNLNSKNKR
jgi:hypothetical protein